MGELLLSFPCSQALQPTRRMDRAAFVVASVQAVAMCGMEDSPVVATSRRVGACWSCIADSFDPISSLTCLRESWMLENCTSSLSGGRRLAPLWRGASSDPTLEKLPNKGGGAPSLAEGVEGRGSTKWKTMQEARSRTQRRKDLQERLDRVRQAASGLRV